MASACGKAFQEGTDKRARGALDLKFQLVRAAGPRECGRAPNSNGDRIAPVPPALQQRAADGAAAGSQGA